MPSANPWAETLWQRVKRIHEQDQLRAEPDGELLRRFADHRDEPAFEELLRRHGPLVWGVCTRTLGTTAEAEDSFQAVFLILVRKAKQIRHRDRVAGWLHGTAQKVVQRSRQQRLRRQSREKPSELIPEPGRSPESPRDWVPLFDRALEKLPEKYREVLILCELQQRTRSEVAGLLSLNENTLSSRLARAKEMLRAKLVPTEVALPAGLVATTAVPAALHSATLQLSIRLASHDGALSILSATLYPLVQGGSKLMFISKSCTCLAVGVLVGLGLINSEAVPQGKSEPQPKTLPKPQSVPQITPVTFVDSVSVAPDPSSATKVRATELERMQGKWEVKQLARRNAVDAPNTDGQPLLFRKDFACNEVWIRGKEIWITLSHFEGVVGTINLGEQFEPRRIDLQLPNKDSTENVWNAFGVYSFAPNGELSIVVGSDRLNRPSLEKEENATAGEVVEFVLARKKENLATLPEEVKELLGGWTVTSAVRNSKACPEISSLEIGPTTILFEMKDAKMRMFSSMGYQVNGTKNPRWFTLQVPKQPDGNDFHGRGIYTLVGDTLTIAFSDKGGRPSEFESRENSGIMVITAKRRPDNSPVAYDLPLPQAKATEPRTPPAVDPSAIEVNQSKILIPFQLDEKQRPEVKEVKLWASHDGGKTFELAVSTPPPGRSDSWSFVFVAQQSGEVHFAIQTVDKQGVAFPPATGLKSELKVRFNLPSTTESPIPPLRAEVAPKPTVPEPERLQKENQELRQRLEELMKRVETLEKAKK